MVTQGHSLSEIFSMFPLGCVRPRAPVLLPRRCASTRRPPLRMGQRRRGGDEDDIDALLEKERKSEVDEEDPDALDKAATFPTFKRKYEERFRLAEPRNWISVRDPHETPANQRRFPFPFNPSFQPPAPISDNLRTQIHAAYMRDPLKNSVRVLSQRHHVSLKRVEAILRLKSLESFMVKQGKPLQTGFLRGMEMLLGVSSETDNTTKPVPRRKQNRGEPEAAAAGVNTRASASPWGIAGMGAEDEADVDVDARMYKKDESNPHEFDSPPREDVHKADLLEQQEKRDAARQRYQRHFWESVVDDGKASEPILPASLQHSRKLAIRMAERALANKSNPRLMPRFRDTPTIKSPRVRVQTVRRAGHLPMRFVDVGGRFIDVQARELRMSKAQRRHAFNSQRSALKVVQGRLRPRSFAEMGKRRAAAQKEKEKLAA
ncbi:hypothetical protein MKEN_01254800 [Mycena kentingensis (nom. inval.)]|nr:hypothetical protein MKEN_01254800 [Mycena kentingensis (nom. inval.)]